jgi:asparagine synthase (glutamine-hydrolysing)
VVDEYVLSERVSARGIFNSDALYELARRHQNGENHDERLWSLVNFEIWQRQFFDGEESSEPSLSLAEAFTN